MRYEMKILVAVAGRHGSTNEIGGAITQTLRDLGHTVDQLTMEGGTDIGRYDAAIVGSAVYMGNWLPDARAFVERNRSILSSMPVWLFSSGPIGPSTPAIDTE